MTHIPKANHAPSPKTTHPAPKQGIFALVLLASFCVQFVSFVLNTEHVLNQQQQSTLKNLAVQLAQEVTLPLSIADKVSLATIAQSSMNHADVGFVGIYNTQQSINITLGTPSDDLHKLTVDHAGQQLGSIELSPSPISHATLIREHWLYLLILLGLHLLIWVAYTVIARPSRKLQDDITAQVREQMIAHSQLNTPTTPDDTKQTQTNHPPPKPHSKTAPTNSIIPNDIDPKNAVVVQIIFPKDQTVFDLIAHSELETYFGLCDELLQKSLNMLCKNSLALKVDYHIVELFDKSGATVVLSTTDKSTSLYLVATLFTKLYLVVNQVIYKKQREALKFAVRIKMIVADPHLLNTANKLIELTQESALVVTQDSHISQISKHIAITPLVQNHITQKNAWVILQAHDAIERILDSLKKQVLSSEQSTQDS